MKLSEENNFMPKQSYRSRIASLKVGESFTIDFTDNESMIKNNLRQSIKLHNIETKGEKQFNVRALYIKCQILITRDK